MRNIVIFTCCLASLSLNVIATGNNNIDFDEYKEHMQSNTLIQTHIVFSPGERTPRTVFRYPTDPHINETYFPFGAGELTLKGRRDSYKLGKDLHKRYKHFIGNVYSPTYFESFTSSYNWSQTALQGVHAGLFPPTKKYQISDNLNWQAIPYYYLSFQDDYLLTSYRACGLQFWISDDLEKSDKYKEKVQEFQPLLSYLTNHTGQNINSTRIVHFLYTKLAAEATWGLHLPNWAYEVYPSPLRTVANWMWIIMAESPDIQRLAAGALLEKITKDSETKATGSNSKKLYLYSTVDFTFTPLMGAIGNYNGASYSTNTYLLFELHRINGVYGIKVFLKERSFTEPLLLSIPGCHQFCPLSQFRELLQDKFPRQD